MDCLVIAEAGVNHNGEVDVALQLIDAAVDAGADIVKFQTFNAERLVTRDAQRAAYQNRNLSGSGSQYAMLKKLELGEKDFCKLFDYCERKKITFLSTPFDSESLRFLVGEGLINQIKVPSGELTNLPFILEIAQTGLPIILSTGMATLSEIEKTLAVIAFGILFPKGKPSTDSFWKAYWSSEGRLALKQKITILHCTTEYPASPDTINLRAMDSLATAFGIKVGLSDHSQGIHIPIAAAARGACIIEKHYTLDRNLPGPDHKASLEPSELKNMISGIKDVISALGDGQKIPAPVEIENRKVVRKVLVASRSIAIGEVFSEDNIETKRNGEGLPPEHYWELMGKAAAESYSVGQPILSGANVR